MYFVFPESPLGFGFRIYILCCGDFDCCEFGSGSDRGRGRENGDSELRTEQEELADGSS
jgi:hypothetical protein